jgi:hypothetical protein
MTSGIELPILIDHDPTKPIGIIREKNGSLFVEFTEDMKITMEWAFNIFGGAALQILEYTEEDEIFFIRKARIIEFSLVKDVPASSASDWTSIP